MDVSNFDAHYIKRPRFWFLLILLLYLVSASLFARYTPPWQAPDEPAHYNYIAHIAAGNGLPVLRETDYDQAYLEKLLTERFPPELSVEPLRYEFYQPPLYYLSAAPIFLLSGGDLFTLRLFNVLLGAISLTLAWFCLQAIFPAKPLIWLSAVAFAGLLPMHVAMSAAVNNDGLAEPLILASILILLFWMQSHSSFQTDTATQIEFKSSRKTLLLLGFVLGLGLLTKIYAYAVLPLCTLAAGLIAWQHQSNVKGGPNVDSVSPPRTNRGAFRHALSSMGWVLLPAFLLGSPTWIRNAYLYGPTDPLGLKWHDQVVIGQATLTAYVDRYGWNVYFERAFNFTFKSFWGVFGWLGVFMDERIYTVLLVLTAVVCLGFLWAYVRFLTHTTNTPTTRFQKQIFTFLGALLLTVFFSYIWYNTKFVQHQGRYLFWGLLPITILFGVGWRESLRPLQGLVTGILGITLTLSLGFSLYLNIDVNKWTILTLGLISTFLLLQPLLLLNVNHHKLQRLPVRVQTLLSTPFVIYAFQSLRTLAWFTPFFLLFLLNLTALFWYVRPFLSVH